jgi:predicted nucleotidyltransferase
MRREEMLVIKKYLQKNFPRVISAYLYGSQASKQMNRQSDVDIAVYGKLKYGALELWNHAQCLASKLHKDVDLVDLEFSKSILKPRLCNRNGIRRRIWAFFRPKKVRPYNQVCTHLFG